MASLKKSWASVAANDQEQIENAPTPKAEHTLKRLPSKQLNNTYVEQKKPREETTETPVDQKEHRLAQRNKQIQIGKSTVGYNRYLAEVPIENRVRGEERHPMTPNPKQDCSKRSWDGQVKVWRRRLHFWTPKDEEDKKEQVEDDFYEKAEEDKQPSASASRPLPEVVPMDKVEPMQLNGENSLLGQWTANSQSSAPMDLQGDSCNPAAFQEDDAEKELIFVPFQFD